MTIIRNVILIDEGGFNSEGGSGSYQDGYNYRCGLNYENLWFELRRWFLIAKAVFHEHYNVIGRNATV